MSRLPRLNGKKSRRNSHLSGQRTRDSRTRHLAYESLEDRRMLFVTYGGGAVWGTTDLTFSYSNMLDNWGSGITNTQITQAVEEAMGIWASVTPLRFTQAGDTGPLPTSADSLYPAASHPLIRWGHHPIDGNPPMGVNVLGHGYQPGTDGRNGDIHFDDGNTFTADGFLELAVHELGHALGLDHPNGDVVAGVCPPPFAAIMHACVGGGGTWDYTALGTAYLLPDDIAGIRSLYDTGLGYVLNATGQLSVFGTAEIDTFSVSYDAGANAVTVSNGINSFTRTMAGVTQIAINGQGGDDTILVNALPTQIITVVNGGAGNDRLIVRGSENGDTLRLVNGSQASNNNSSILFSDISSVTLSGNGGADVLEVVQAPANLPVTINGGELGDEIYLANLGSTGAIRSAVTINGDNGNDTVYLAWNAPGGISVIDAPVVFNGGAGVDTLNVGSGGLHAVSGLVTFHGGNEGNVLNLFDGANPFFVDYTITDSSVTRDEPFFFGGVNYTGVNIVTLDATQGPNAITVNSASSLGVTINGNGGNDAFVVGGGNIGPSISNLQATGGEGADRLVLDDHLSTHSTFPWFVYGATGDPNTNNTVNLALNAYTYNGFEEVEVRAGLGDNAIHVVGDMTASVFVDGGGGSDSFILEHVSNYQDFDDSGQGGSPAFHYTLDVDGGSGFNSLTVNDAASFGRSYTIGPDHVLADEGAPLGLEFDYDSFQNVTLQGATNGQFSPEFLVLGISSDISVIHQFTILGGPHPERFVIRPRDAAGNLTINGNLGIGGGGDLDTLVVNDADSSLPINYRFFNRFGVGRTEIGGLGAGGFGAASDVESFVVNAGTASDTFQVDHLSSGSLAITGGNGDDVLEITPTAKNIAANIGATTNINFDGGTGSDSMRLHNDNASFGVTYIINGTLLRAIHEFGGPTFAATFFHSLVEQTAITGGPQLDFFVTEATVAGANYDFDGGPGAVGDGYFFGSQFSPRTDPIRGRVRVTGAGGGNDVITLYNSFDTIGRTFHIGTDSVGAALGDNLFGPGGYLNYVDVTGTMTIFLGSGPDTIYAMPNADTPITIDANNPTTAPGDKLYLQLELAGAINPVVSNPSAPNGNVTSSNLRTLNWTGIDQPVTVLIPGDFNLDGSVGASDLAVWRAAVGVSAAGDGDGDGDTDGADFLVWQRRLGSSSASPASESFAEASPVEAAPHQEIRRFGLPPGPFPIGAVDGSVEEPKSVAANRADARVAAFSQERNHWTAFRREFIDAPWRQALSDRRLLAVSGIEREVDRTWRDVNEDGKLSLKDLDFAYAEYEASL